MAVAGLALLVACYFVGCGAMSGGGSDDDAEQNTSWFCQERSSTCECRAYPSDTTYGGVSEVDQCSGHDCCVYSDEATPDVEATCTCFTTEATCEQEAATRPGTEVVATCPPGAPPVEVLCADEGENCSFDYLRQNGFEGCCEGTLCRQDTNGIPTCHAASSEELALHARCDAQANRTSGFTSLEVQPTTLITSHGGLTIGGIGWATYSTGPGGCLNDFSFNVGDRGCRLDFAGSIVDGVLAVTDLGGFVDACPGFTGTLSDGQIDSAPEVVTAFSFDGLSCDAGLALESYCVAGAFTFALDGTAGSLTFEPQVLKIEGAMCDFSQVSGSCPTSG